MHTANEFSIMDFAKEEAGELSSATGAAPADAEQQIVNVLTALMRRVGVGNEVTSFPEFDDNNRPCVVVLTKTGESTFTINRTAL